MPIPLLAGCTQAPEWEIPVRKAAEVELEHAITQLEMNSAMGARATHAEERMLVALEFGEGTESNLCIWHNGKNIGNHLIGKRISIQDISINGRMVKVSFLNDAGALQQKEFDYQIFNSDFVQINY